MSAAFHPFDDLIQFLLQMKPEAVLEFKVSPYTQKQVRFLLDKEKIEGLTRTEKNNLDKYMLMEDVMIIAKARAKKELLATQ